MRFFVIGRRIDGGFGPVEVPEEEARAKHEAGEEVHYSDAGGPMQPVPRVAPEEAQPVKKAKKG